MSPSNLWALYLSRLYFPPFIPLYRSTYHNMRGSLVSFFVLAASLTAVFAAPAPQSVGDLVGDLGLGSLTSDVNGIVAGVENDPNVVPGRTSMVSWY